MTVKPSTSISKERLPCTGRTTVSIVLVNVYKILSHEENNEATIFLTCAATSFTTTQHAEDCEDSSISAIAVA